MKPFADLTGESLAFWAHVKLVSEKLRYSTRKLKKNPVRGMRRYEFEEIGSCLEEQGLQSGHLVEAGKPTVLGLKIQGYLNKRAEVIEDVIRPDLMTREQARIEFEKLQKRIEPKRMHPMNKQKNEKKHPAYLTGIVNMLTEEALGDRDFDADPGCLTVFTHNKVPIHTFPRRMDGAYPSVVDPTAVWEIKEFYGTTTFGSRVSDVVYETMLDGYERLELQDRARVRLFQYLIVDATAWWDDGRSYLCRLVDILHMGLVDEILFGREVLTRWPEIVADWP